MRNWIAITAVAAASLATVGCSTWDDMNRSQKAATIGAGTGAVLGATTGSGSVGRTVGGATIGGAVGYGIGEATK